MRYIPACVICLFLTACHAMLQLPDESDAVRAQQKWLHYDLARLKQSHQLYIEKCGGCHTLYLPNYKKAEQWSSVMDGMALEAKLDSVQKEMILNYLVVMAAKPEQTKKN